MKYLLAVMLLTDCWADADSARYNAARLNRTGPLVVYVGTVPSPKLPGLVVDSLRGVQPGVLYLPRERGWVYWFPDAAALHTWLTPAPVKVDPVRTTIPTRAAPVRANC